MKYLVALDNSPEALDAFVFGMNLFTHADHVILLNVVPEVGLLPLVNIDKTIMNEVNIQLLRKSKKLLKEFGHKLTESDIPHTLLSGKGDAKSIVCKEAKKNNVDLVIIGRQNLGTIQRVLVGSNSEYCANKLKCDILVVPAQRQPVKLPEVREEY